ncbi:MAG: hypothetical protein ACKVP7_13640 [Hyphomicrobiaceae bacterium]
MVRALSTLVVVAALILGSGFAPLRAETTRAPHGSQTAQASQLTPDYFVGVWSTRNIEFGQDVEIIWTLWRDRRLAYQFIINGTAYDGSGGTWAFDGTMMHEYWNRADGSKGEGKGFVEWIDANTIRLTIEDNGDPKYKGLSRVYRRKSPPQTSMRL